MDRAIRSYRRALERKPDFSPSTRKLGDMYLIEGLQAEAESAYGALVSSPDTRIRARSRTYLAFIPMHRGELGRALRVLDEAIAADARDGVAGPETAEKHLMKALIYEEKRDPASALTELERGERIWEEKEPYDQAPWTWCRVRLLAKAGRPSEAEDLLRTLKENAEERAPALMGYFCWGSGALALARGDAKEAADLLERGFELPMLSGHPLDVRCAQAQARLASGEPEKAATELESALARYEAWEVGWPLDWARGHYLLARAYEESGRSGRAVEQYEKFLSIWKDADSDLQEVVDARTRVARLRS
jgi:tetratricopeptide (TPR) repeat protein